MGSVLEPANQTDIMKAHISQNRDPTVDRLTRIKKLKLHIYNTTDQNQGINRCLMINIFISSKQQQSFGLLLL
jgi:hypothetical protein